MKVQGIDVKCMMIGSMTTGCFFCGQVNSRPRPFELTGCGSVYGKSLVDQFALLAKTARHISKAILALQTNVPGQEIKV
jgi:hypothetical protein